MMAMSKPLSAGQAQRYHQEQLRDAGENYYSEGQQILGQWEGRLAEEWGVAGAVDDVQFARLSEGHHPVTNEPLVRLQPADAPPDGPLARVHWRVRPYGESSGGLTISAPESVSVTALVGGDARARPNQAPQQAAGVL